LGRCVTVEGARARALRIVFASLLAGMVLGTPVDASRFVRATQLAPLGNVTSGTPDNVMRVSYVSGSPSRLATLDGFENSWARAAFASVSNVLVEDPTEFYSNGQGWDLGENLFHTTAETTNFTPPDDPDFNAIGYLLTDGISEWLQLATWESGGGGTSSAAPESYWLHGNPDLVGSDVDFIRLVIHDLSFTPVDGGTQVLENYTWEIWGHSIFVAFYPPTDPNGTYLIDRRFTNVNVSLAEPGTAVLEWNGVNLSMDGTGTNWRLNVSNLTNGANTYRVWATNSTGAVFVSHPRRLTVGVGIWTLRDATYGFFPSAAYDANGTLHVCFDGAIYGTFNSNGWQFTQIEGGAGGFCSLALDHEGYPHVSYIQGPDYYGNLNVRYASFNGTAWNIETVDQGGDTFTSLALDPVNDLPRIAYSPYYAGLRLASFNGTSWTIEVVDPTVNGARLSLAVDSDDHPSIAYTEWSADGLRYARGTGSSWNLSVVDQSGEQSGDGPSLKLDSNGDPHVAYITRTGLKYASLNGTAWSNETVDVKTFSWLSLALDMENAPHIAYATLWGGDVRYATKNDTWGIQVVAHNYGASGVALALGPEDTPGIVFTTNVPEGDLLYATTGVDTIPPSTTIQLTGTSGTAGWFRSSVRIDLAATDDVGVRNTTYRVDLGSWRNYTGPFDVTGDGSHTVDYYSTDDAGNSEVMKTAFLRIDSLSPTVSLETTGVVGRGGWYRSAVNVSLFPDDATSGVANVRYQVDIGPWTAYVGPFTVSGDGWHYVRYTAVDGAGNDAAVGTALVKIDATPPSSTLSVSGTVGGLGWYSTPASVSLSASDGIIGVVSVRYSLDNGTWQNYSHPLVIADGRHVLSYRAEDAAGNVEAPHSISIDVDMTAPIATITSPSALTIVASDRVTVTWTAADDLSGLDHVDVLLDGGPAIQLGASARSYTFPGLGDGSHTVQLRVVDVAGNAAATARVFSVDATNPIIAITGPESGAVITSSSATVTWIASDTTSGVDHIAISIDGGDATALPATTAFRTFTKLADGTHIVNVQVVDRAGNAATSMVTFRVDTGIFSPSGPYGSSLIVGVSLAILFAAAALVLVIRRRRRGRPPKGGA